MDGVPDLSFSAPSPEELQPFFPAYEIGGFIAQGGMGAVYTARQISLDRPVAIKILPRQFGDDPHFRTCFEAEAKSMARLNHPNLIAVYDFGDADGMLYIIMELVEGKSLYHSAHGKAIEQSEAARLVAGVSRGLAHAHQHGILHRDIKPGNILLSPGVIPKIGDFGLARPVGAEHNPEEVVWGTPGYSAPEVVNHPHAVDERTDIYAVGVLLYELLTAKLPSEPWKPPSAIANCSAEFDPLVRRATHPSPGMRFAKVEDLATDLERLAKKLSTPVLQRQTSRVSLKPASSGPPPSSAPHLPTPPKPKGVAPYVIAALVVAIATIGTILYTTSTARESAGAANEIPAETPVADPSPKPVPPVPEPEVIEVKTPPQNAASGHRKEPRPQPRPEPEPKEEPQPRLSPSEFLAKHREALRTGDLAGLADVASERADAYHLLFDQPLSWLEASYFAEDHGAQLAVLPSSDDLSWAVSEFELAGPAWLGLSDSGTEDRWHWVDGSPANTGLWASGQPDDTISPEDGEDFGALLPNAQLADFANSRPLPVLLQWPKGPRDGSLESQLKRVAESFSSRSAPLFPAGSRNVDGSRFLLVSQATSWEEASALAIAAGGHLAVPSSETEAKWIEKTLQSVLGDDEACWVGGRLDGEGAPQWTYVTGEKFEFVSWAPDQPDQSETPQPALQVRRRGEGPVGYHNAPNEAEQTNYLLIEWSALSRRNLPDENRAPGPRDVGEWLRAQRTTTAERERVDYERWKRRHDDNLADFIDDIKSEAATARRFPKAAKDFVNALAKELVKTKAVPAQLQNRLAQRFIGRIQERAHEKQERHWDDYAPEFVAAQKRYQTDINAEADRRRNQGKRPDQALLLRELAASADRDYFLRILSGEFPDVPEPEEPADSDKEE